MEKIYQLVLAVLFGSYLQAIGFWAAAVRLGRWLVWDLWAWLFGEIRNWWNTEDDDPNKLPPGIGTAAPGRGA